MVNGIDACSNVETDTAPKNGFGLAVTTEELAVVGNSFKLQAIFNLLGKQTQRKKEQKRYRQKNDLHCSK